MRWRAKPLICFWLSYVAFVSSARKNVGMTFRHLSSTYPTPWMCTTLQSLQSGTLPSLKEKKDVVNRCVEFGYGAGSVSSSSTLQIFLEASHLWWLLCPPVYLLGHFPSLRYVQGDTPTGAFEGGCRPFRWM